MDMTADLATSTSPVPRRRGRVTGWFDPHEPREYLGPFARWPRTADAALAFVVFAGSVLAVAVSELGDDEDLTFGSVADLPFGALALLAAAAGTLLWRRSAAVEVASAVMVVTLVWAFAGFGDGHDAALAVACYSVGRYTPDLRHSTAVVIAAAAVSICGTLIDGDQRVDIAPALLLTSLPWYVGRRVRNRRDYLALLEERAERLQAQHQAEARRAVADERARIARELHDVVAHQVSMMTVQAGAAKTIAREDLEGAIEAMGDVERGGRQALGELRHLLGVLRPDADPDDDLVPQPGMDGIPALVDRLVHTGADVTVERFERPPSIAAAIDLSAYRIVQESLTNIVKHAGPEPTVTLGIAADGDTLAIDITNTTTQATAELPASGWGLVGMRERVQLLGGSLDARTEAGEFRIRARIPLRSEPA